MPPRRTRLKTGLQASAVIGAALSVLLGPYLGIVHVAKDCINSDVYAQFLSQ